MHNIGFKLATQLLIKQSMHYSPALPDYLPCTNIFDKYFSLYVSNSEL